MNTRKLLVHVILILFLFVAYFLQANFFNWFTIAGVMPNIFIICIVLIGLFGNKFMGVTYGVILGFILDFLFRQKIGITAITLGIVGGVAKLFDRNFSKDSRITVMLIIGAATAMFEIISYIASYIVFSQSLEILAFAKVLLIEVIYNIILTVILYPLIQKIGYYVENTYKENRILTRYF